MKSQLAFLLAALIGFAAYTGAVVVDRGYTGFLSLAWAEPWAGQMLMDLAIALTLFLVWMLRDARERDIPIWPYAALLITTGSIGALAYLVHRTTKSAH